MHKCCSERRGYASHVSRRDTSGSTIRRGLNASTAKNSAIKLHSTLQRLHIKKDYLGKVHNRKQVENYFLQWIFYAQ
jgi:hypothetical protein